jgi:hypothetical protein
MPLERLKSALPVSLHILWVEPPIDLLANKSLLGELSACGMSLASSHREVFDLRNSNAINVAVLSDALGLLMLGAVARCVRSQWPMARILLLKRKQPLLEDHLYDDEMEYRLLPKELHGGLARLLNCHPKQKLLN